MVAAVLDLHPGVARVFFPCPEKDDVPVFPQVPVDKEVFPKGQGEEVLEVLFILRAAEPGRTMEGGVMLIVKGGHVKDKVPFQKRRVDRLENNSDI